MPSHDNNVRVHGEVLRPCGSGQYDVRLTGRQIIGNRVTDDIVDELLVGYEIKASPAGKLSVYNIKIVEGDEVIVALSPENIAFGRIVRRLRTDDHSSHRN
ncbi:hypothetical protein H6771_02675 [Candidatus Peribacteria bacterium]|nr:hypothetical protein [Candidatus Peribacteria bacterium]